MVSKKMERRGLVDEGKRNSDGDERRNGGEVSRR